MFRKVLRTDPQAQLFVRKIVKEWIETDEVNVLQHANADDPCLSIRSYESADMRDLGKIIGLEHVVRPPYPTLPQDVNLQSGQDERKKSPETCASEDQRKKETLLEPCSATPSVPASTSSAIKQLPQVAVYGKDRNVDIARERDLLQMPMKSISPPNIHQQQHPQASPTGTITIYIYISLTFLSADIENISLQKEIYSSVIGFMDTTLDIF